MEILKYIESRDVRTHLEEIDYSPTALEAAFIIWSNALLRVEKRHKLWKELINNMPDTSFWTDWGAYWESLHDYLTKLMKLEKRWLEEFDTIQDGDYYTYEMGKTPAVEGGPFSSFWDCLDAIDARFDCFEADSPYSLSTFSICKKNRNNPQECITVSVNNVGSICNIQKALFEEDEEASELVNEGFSASFIPLPVPFGRGDILISTKDDAQPCVLLGPATGYPPVDVPLTTSDSETLSWVFAVGKDGQIELDCCFVSFYEYYRLPLDGKHRMLKPISLYLKGEIDLATLLQSVIVVHENEQAKQMIPSGCSYQQLKDMGIL